MRFPWDKILSFVEAHPRLNAALSNTPTPRCLSDLLEEPNRRP